MGRARETVKRFVPAPVRHALRRKVLRPMGIGVTLVPEVELQDAYERSLKVLLAAGDRAELGEYVEFGVCHGTSMACMARASDAVGLRRMRLIGFDSFEGLPEGVEDEDDGIWRSGQYKASERTARRTLKRAGVPDHRVALVKGWFDETATPETAVRLGLQRVSLAMIDCDVYSSTVTALAFLAPLLADTSVLVFDDWNSGGLADRNEGERRAFEEWLAEHPEFQVIDELEPYVPHAHIAVIERR
jgi:O-methyltransferase